MNGMMKSHMTETFITVRSDVLTLFRFNRKIFDEIPFIGDFKVN